MDGMGTVFMRQKGVKSRQVELQGEETGSVGVSMDGMKFTLQGTDIYGARGSRKIIDRKTI